MKNSAQCATERTSRTVHFVDDDPMVLTAVARLLRMHDFVVVPHDNAEAFLASYDDDAGCAVVDISMPGMDGLALQSELLRRHAGPPLVFLSGLADVPACAAAMRRGAVDFLRKPVDETELLAAVEAALARDARDRANRRTVQEVRERFDTLSPREREVVELVMEGRLNKQIAGDLDITEKTVKVHRARGMAKIGVRSVAALVRVAERGARAAAALL
ncbi:response regulator transcription factor [Ramlibacter ginsenosidimutans]|uniref:Response regulator transcription factor n=1 Tax=Ramlibacter ginsenosidimutans TaxID=502333 RepID=A0A934WPJ3_9BURK|nr:response regulator [Ramlibacter ginsenosidimutans]MBK6008525.1 response regulator transcription factor [Ramlibacter ginsenosidimutans]